MDEFAKAGSKTAQGYTELEASSLAVGLPEGLMGNSEVGHLNIGAGRVVWQDVCDYVTIEAWFLGTDVLLGCQDRSVNQEGDVFRE